MISDRIQRLRSSQSGGMSSFSGKRLDVSSLLPISPTPTPTPTNGGGVFPPGGSLVQFGQTLTEATSDEMFGFDLDINESGDRIIVSSRASDQGVNNGGKVQVFDFDGNNWNQVGQTLLGTSALGYFGHTVAINDLGNRIAIGEYSSNNNDGAVYVYQFDGTSWNQLGQTLTGRTGLNDRMGFVSMDSSGNTITVGAEQADVDEVQQTGYVKVYSLNGSNQWVQVGQTIVGEMVYSSLGRTKTANNGTRILTIAAPGSIVYAQVYDLVGGVWTQVGETFDQEFLNSSNIQQITISQNGQKLLVATNDTFYIYSFDGTNWIASDPIFTSPKYCAGCSINEDGTVFFVSLTDSENFSDSEIKMFRFNEGTWSELTEYSIPVDMYTPVVVSNNSGDKLVHNTTSFNPIPKTVRTVQYTV